MTLTCVDFSLQQCGICFSLSFNSALCLFQYLQPNSNCFPATAHILATDPEYVPTLEGMLQFCSSGCRVVGLPGGSTTAALFVAGVCVLEALHNVFAVVGSGRLCPFCEELPVVRTEAG